MSNKYDAAGPAPLPKPGPSRADEPLAAKFSTERTADFLDAAAVGWTRERRCGSCHTNYPYLWARTALKM